MCPKVAMSIFRMRYVIKPGRTNVFTHRKDSWNVVANPQKSWTFMTSRKAKDWGWKWCQSLIGYCSLRWIMMACCINACKGRKKSANATGLTDSWCHLISVQQCMLNRRGNICNFTSHEHRIELIRVWISYAILFLTSYHCQKKYLACVPLRSSTTAKCLSSCSGFGSQKWPMHYQLHLASASAHGMHWEILHHQWSFQEPKLEVPTIYKAYVRPM